MKMKKDILFYGMIVLFISVALMIVVQGGNGKQETIQTTAPLTQESEVFELDMVPWVPIDADSLFNDSYWYWVVGPTVGSVFSVQFHPDGTVEYCRTTDPQIEVSHYECDGQLLTFNGITYWWDGACFQSTVKYDAPMEPDGTYYTIGPDSEMYWRQYLIDVQLARKTTCEEFQQALEIAKHLVKVVHQDGTRISEYEFLYDENGMLTHVTETRNVDQEPYSITTFSYNDEGRLTSREIHYNVKCVGNVSTVYRYDANGKLVSSINQSEEGGCNVEYKYDLLGYPEVIKAVYHASEASYYFMYDYDEQIRQYSSGTAIDSSSRGFTYQYKPFLTYTDGQMFLLDKYGNGNALTMDTGAVLYGFEFQNPWYICDEDGYLTKIVDGSAICEFYYE